MEMTEAEIMKALECCSKVIEEGCAECPMYEKDCNEVSLEKLALDLINRKNAECKACGIRTSESIEKLQKQIAEKNEENEDLQNQLSIFTKLLDKAEEKIAEKDAEIERLKYCNAANVASVATLLREKETARAEAIKEVLEKTYHYILDKKCGNDFTTEDLWDIAQEMGVEL